MVRLDQGIDTSTPLETMFFHILGSITEFEHALMVKCTIAGMTFAGVAVDGAVCVVVAVRPFVVMILDYVGETGN